MSSERPLAEQLAREVLRDPSTHGWLAPLAREYLALIQSVSSFEPTKPDATVITDPVAKVSP